MGNEMLSIAVSDIGIIRILKLSGDLDSFTSERLVSAAGAWVPESGRLLINLDDLEYIDSSGLSALVLISERARKKGVPMSIACDNARVYRVLEITGLRDFFKVEGILPDSTMNMDISGVGLTDEAAYQPRKVHPQIRGLQRGA